MINEKLKLAGHVSIELKKADGSVENTEIRNLVVDAGLAYIASRMVGTDKGVMTHMALGSSTTAAAAGDTDLGSLLGVREAIDTTTITGTLNEKVEYVCTFEAGDATGAVTEAGIFNDGTSGDMLCRTVFPVVNKAADDIMTVTWTITLSAA